MTADASAAILSAAGTAGETGVVSRLESGDCARTAEGEGHGALVEGLCAAVCTFRRAASLKRFLDSLAGQDRKPDLLVIVDASPDAETEEMLRAYPRLGELAACVRYFRVEGPHAGLTRQRNFALTYVTTDLVAFFDDDVVLLDGCLREMEATYRQRGAGGAVAGVGAFIQPNREGPAMGRIWRIRRLLRIVPNLRPGSYTRSGVSIPWTFLEPTEGLVEGDWLAGCAMMWPTAAARQERFNDLFSGYSSGEDLEFSLRMKSRGRLVVSGRARVLHLEESGGRPDAARLGYMYARNNYYIHRHRLRGRTWKDALRFFYAWGLDSLVEAANLFAPARRAWTRRFLLGRAQFFAGLLLRHDDGFGARDRAAQALTG